MGGLPHVCPSSQFAPLLHLLTYSNPSPLPFPYTHHTHCSLPLSSPSSEEFLALDNVSFLHRHIFVSLMALVKREHAPRYEQLKVISLSLHESFRLMCGPVSLCQENNVWLYVLFVKRNMLISLSAHSTL